MWRAAAFFFLMYVAAAASNSNSVTAPNPPQLLPLFADDTMTSSSLLQENASSSKPTTTSTSSLVQSSASASASSSSVLVKETVTVSALEGGLRRAVVVHGLLMYCAFGLLFPMGVLAARFLQLARRHPHPNARYLLRPLFFSHLLLQWLGIIIMTSGAIQSFFNFGFFMIHTHGRLGLCLWILIWLQTLTSISRPNLGTKTRTVWYFAHWLMGTASVLLGFYDFYSGIYMWEQRAFSSAKIINVCFSVSLALMVAVYFLQDRWENLMLQHQKNHDNKENPQVQHDENNEKAITLAYV